MAAVLGKCARLSAAVSRNVSPFSGLLGVQGISARVSRLHTSPGKLTAKFQKGRHQKVLLGGVAAVAGVGVLVYFKKSRFWILHAASGELQGGDRKAGLPEYSLKDVEKHKGNGSRIWVTYKHGVYDITEFIDLHPGGEKIKLAAGGSLEPFWHLYAAHKKPEVYEILETYRIGNFKDAGKVALKDASDPYRFDPDRHPALKRNTEKPFNAESPPELLVDNFITPSSLFFVRNHLPVPEVDMKKYRLVIEVQGKKPISLSLQDLKKKYKKHTITATLQCAGNRRKEMSSQRPVKGLSWTFTAISNAEWSGVLLVDVLKAAGVSLDDPKNCHVQFEGLDKDESNNPYGASVPIEIAMNPFREVLLAYEMNGEDIPTDHGYPVRVICPGIAGARNVKWLSKIVVSPDESPSFWQQRDYKSFSPSIDWDTADFSKSPALQDFPITSAICVPSAGQKIDGEDGEITLKGYAWSGGGRGIMRVDISADGGKTWQVASLQKPGQRPYQEWSWTLWEVDVPIPEGFKGNMELICKAVDSSHNVQPDSVAGIWNLRGLMNNSWHRINVEVN
ncbi:sulfite oxidase [Lingula anatina]|uniref:Sulfite oxidase n=1 Tax=Lingula anatina TaxID=7574 RepID=A0A1S3HIG1_LINAN|nr:sulfite oxidase [Lingula anatina]|eukprot:XP_013385251.1 sulfite oxidase [Lingula anatina]